MPDNANEVYFPSNGMGVTYDGGETTEQVRWGGDNHDMWADPKDPAPDDDRQRRRRHDLDDARASSGASTRLPIGQMYHVADRQPDPVHASTARCRTTARCAARAEQPGGYGIRRRSGRRPPAARRAGRRPTPWIPNIVWGGCYAGVVERFDARTGMARSVSACGRSARWAPTRARSSSG